MIACYYILRQLGFYNSTTRQLLLQFTILLQFTTKQTCLGGLSIIHIIFHKINLITAKIFVIAGILINNNYQKLNTARRKHYLKFIHLIL